MFLDSIKVNQNIDEESKELKTMKQGTLLPNEQLSPQVYVVCLASYAAGRLVGKWVDATLPIEAILEQIKQLLAHSAIPNAAEFAIHSSEGFYSLKIDTQESLEAIHEKAQFIAKHGELGAALLAYYAGEVKQAETAMKHSYQGAYENELDFATDFFHGKYFDHISHTIYNYVDYPKFQKDIFLQDYFSITVKGRCHVFWSKTKVSQMLSQLESSLSLDTEEDIEE